MCKYTQDPILGMKCQMLCVARKANRAGKLWGLQLHFSVKRRRGLRETRSSRSRCLFANHSLEFLPDLPPSPTSTCLWWPASSPKGAGSSWRPWCTPSGLNLASNPWQSRAILNNPRQSWRLRHQQLLLKLTLHSLQNQKETKSN